MNKEFFKKNQGLIIAVVIIIVLIIISVSRNSDKKTTIPEKNQTEEQTIDGEDQTKEPAKSTPEKPATGATGSLIREGTLLTTDNPSRGNYMIKTATSNFYLKTSRDFSQLLNKQVKMVADGTVEKFTLIDIVAK